MAIRFVPTILVILLSFAWQMLVIDLKKVTPWAAMTGKWTEPRESILANYIDDLEIMSVWNSFRRKHWGILIALLGGFLCGSLVPFTGGLFYVDPLHESTYNSTLVRTSRFEFNGSLNAFDLSNPKNQQQEAAVTEMDQSDVLSPWTSSEYAFETFNLSDTHYNVALSTDSAAFGGTLACDIINYNTKVTREWYTQDHASEDPTEKTPGLLTNVELIPNEEDMVRIGCKIIPAFYPEVIFSRPSDQSVKVLPAAWMNVTNCSNTEETLLTMTTMVLLGANVNDTAIEFHTKGLLCRPHFSIRTLEIVVNASTAELMKITQSSNTSTPIDIGIDTATLDGVMNRQGANSDELENYNTLVPLPDVLNAASKLNVEYTAYIGRDPWFTRLVRGNFTKMFEYTTDMKALATDSSQLFQSTMAQIANVAFRSNDSSPVPGFLMTREPRITIQRSSLLFLQSALGLLGSIAICCATVLRPKSCLKEDPATLAALSIIVASSRDFQEQFKNKGHLDSRRYIEGLESLKVRLNTEGHSKPSIEIRNSAVSPLIELSA